MNDPISRAAFHWWQAEREADPTLPSKLTIGDILARAVPRVTAVFAGEVRWSDAGPGDRAVWKGRPRDIEEFHRSHLIGHREWLNVFDTVEMVPPGEYGRRTNYPHCTSFRAFGNMNVGNYALTNMQVAGQLGHDAFNVKQSYAVVDRPITTADDVMLTLIIGCMPVHAALPLREWILGIPVGRIIPTRQNFSVLVSARISTPLEISIHLEGTTNLVVQ